MSTLGTTSRHIGPLTIPEPARTDSDIREGIELVLRSSSIAGERNVYRVTVRGGHVTLTGRLACRSHIGLATRLAWSVHGVTAVHNWLDYVWAE